MALQTTSGSLVVVGANTEVSKVYWRGVHLVEVVKITIHHDGDPLVRLRVNDTGIFEGVYEEMRSAGIIIKEN